MALFYQVFAHVHPGQCNRVLVHAHTFPVHCPVLPAPSLVSFGNFHTLRRYFPTPEQAQTWAGFLRSSFAIGPVKNPSLGGYQIELFKEFEK
jgi:hypothetical protein